MYYLCENTLDMKIKKKKKKKEEEGRRKPRTSHQRSPGGERHGKEEAPDDLPTKDERGQSSVKQVLEPFGRQRWENF